MCGEIAVQKLKTIITVISTVLPGAIDREIRPLLNQYIKFCYNPFFIAMGTTMDDFLHPEFVLLGTDDADVAEKLQTFYSTIHDARVFHTDIASVSWRK